MSRNSIEMTDAELDVALDLLKPPAPSETLVGRVRRMAPEGEARRRTPFRPFGLVAAAAAVAVVIAAAVLQTAPAPNASVPVATVDDPAGEISVSELNVTGETPTADAAAEPISLAGLPLE